MESFYVWKVVRRRLLIILRSPPISLYKCTVVVVIHFQSGKTTNVFIIYYTQHLTSPPLFQCMWE